MKYKTGEKLLKLSNQAIAFTFTAVLPRQLIFWTNSPRERKNFGM
jgi:hypothetical protein